MMLVRVTYVARGVTPFIHTVEHRAHTIDLEKDPDGSMWVRGYDRESGGDLVFSVWVREPQAVQVAPATEAAGRGEDEMFHDGTG